MLTIGSAALLNHGLLDRQPKDFDSIMTWKEFEDDENISHAPFRYPTSDKKWIVRFPTTIFEIEIAWEGTTAAELLERAGNRTFATPEECLALKLSHRYLKNSPHFLKTMRDIQMLREHGYVLDEWLVDWVKRRELETYGYTHPALNRSKDDFFSDDGIDYKFDHDSLHEAVALQERPAYTYFKADNAEVFCDMDKFETLPHQTKINAVWEESAVLALERSVVPFESDPERAFQYALQKVCTSITSGRFREFAWEHYDEVLELGHNFIDLFKKGLRNGVVKLNDRA